MSVRYTSFPAVQLARREMGGEGSDSKRPFEKRKTRPRKDLKKEKELDRYRTRRRIQLNGGLSEETRSSQRRYLPGGKVSAKVEICLHEKSEKWSGER